MILRGAKAIPSTVPSPIDGWNARDSLAAMKPTDAVILDNIFPGFGSCRTRGGSAAYANTLGGSVKMLAEFNAKTFRQFIAAANGKLWNISVAGAGSQIGTGYTNDAWEWAQMDGPGGTPKMGFVNGSDAPQTWDGAATANMVVSGPTVANLNGIHIHKSRSYFWDDRTGSFWYSAVNALGGVLAEFPLGRVGGAGGNMLMMATWSHDSGNGLQDLAVFALNSGDVFVYSGSDPSSSTDWALVGRYAMSPPINKRCFIKLGADLVIATRAGYVSLADVIARGRYDEENAVSSRIRGAVLDAVRASTAFGWEMKHYPAGNYLLVNVPTTTSEYHQHVMNTETKRWCRFKGQNALCWGLFNNELYFGTSSGTVLKADSGTDDNGTPIRIVAVQAWNSFKRINNRVTALQMQFRHQNLPFVYQAGIAYDFGDAFVNITRSISPPASQTWADWEASVTWALMWGGEAGVVNSKASASGSGRYVGLALSMSLSNQRIEWMSSTYLIEPGGF